MKTIYVKDAFRRAVDSTWINWRRALPTLAFLCAMFFLGRAAAGSLGEPRQASGGKVLENENWGRPGAETHRKCLGTGTEGIQCVFLRGGRREGHISDI